MSEKDKSGKGFFDAPTGKTSSNKGFFDAPTRAKRADDTKKVSSTGGDTVASNPALGAKTTRFNPSGGDSAENAGTNVQSSGDGYHPEYVVGWLVVTEGPGRGISRPLGYGMNPVGREEEQGVRLDFGDSEISRNGHCSIAYDHKHGKFFIQHGDGQNLTYLNDQPVLNPAELGDGATIVLGSTTLRFVAFCDDQFSWDSDSQ